MNLSDILALCASGVVFLVYSTYLVQMIKGQSTPNPATWIIWLTISVLNAITFFQVADTWYQGLIAITMTVFVCTLFFYALKKKKFTSLQKLEMYVLAFTGIIVLTWILTGNQTLANLLLQISLLASFWPTLQGLYTGKAKEKPLPWVLAVGAYLLIIISMVLNFQGNYAAFVYPLVNGVIGNGSVAILAWMKR